MIMKNLKTLILFGTVFSSTLNAQTQTSFEHVVIRPAAVRPVVGAPRDFTNGTSFLTERLANPSAFNLNNFGSNLNLGVSSPHGAVPFWLDENYRSPGYRYTNYLTNSDAFSCAAPDDAISNLSEALDTQECYDKKHSYQRQDPANLLSEKQLIESDKAVCECLHEKAKTLEPLREVLNAKIVNLPNLGQSNNIVQNFRENRINAQKRMYRRVAGLSFQASIISGANSEFSAAYTANTAPNPITVDLTIIGNIVPRFGISSVKERETIALGLKREMEALDVPVTPVRRLYVEAPFRPDLNQCVGGREFQAFKSLPSDDLLFQELSSGEFSPFDWNYNSLKNRFKALVQLPLEEKLKNKQQIAKLKSKLLFLESNQMMKSIFSAQSADKYEDFLKESQINVFQKGLIIATATPDKISAMQTELHGILKSFADVGKKCQGQGKVCFAEATKGDGTSKYKEALNNFFKKPHVFTMAKAQTDKENYDESRGLLNEDNFLPPESSKPENMTQELLINKFISTTALGDPDQCKGGADFSKCAEIYSAYCKTVDSALESMRGVDGDDTIKDDLDVKTENLLNTDIISNRDFAEFNREICNTPMKKNSRDQNEKPLTFFQFKDEFCQKYNNPPECGLRTPKDYESIRQKFQAEYKHPADPARSNMSPAERLAFLQTSVDSPVVSMNDNQAEKVAKGHTDYSFGNSIGSVADFSSSSLPNTDDAKSVPFSGVAKGLGSLASAMGGSSESSSQDEGQANYSSSNLIVPQVSSQIVEVPKVENMPQTEREELLEDWKKEMAEWKAKRDSPDSLERANAIANESTSKAKIEALEQLLAQQKKLTEDQYKLINDSIAAQSRAPERSIASVQDDSDTPKLNRKRSSNGIVSSNAEVDNETQRAPGNNEQQLNTSGSGGGAGAAATSRTRNSSSNAISDSGDSVSREEAKLVNLRENSNGSITITSSVAGGPAATAANAIVIPVTDAFYQTAQSNPSGLNLSQLEQSIPKDQIAKLQDRGDYFILLLQNGTNPPLEVKVKKDSNNKLVQVDGAPIVSRRVSLEGLLNTLPSRVPASTR
jgi:hypothetical protein